MLQDYKAYFSHSIRGQLSTNATPESMKANNERAHEAAVLVRCVLPEISLYVPGEHDFLISILYQNGRLTEEDILWGDCEIVKNCDILIAWAPDRFISTGMEIEIDFARKHNIPTYIIEDVVELQFLKPEIIKLLRDK